MITGVDFMKCNSCKHRIKTDTNIYCAKSENRQVTVRAGENAPVWCPKNFTKERPK